MKRASAYALLLLLATAMLGAVTTYADGRGRLGYRAHHPAARYHHRYVHARRHHFHHRAHHWYRHHRPFIRHRYYAFRHRHHFYPWPAAVVFVPPVWYSPYYYPYPAVPYMSFNFSFYDY